MKKLNEMSAKELKELAKELKVASWWTKNKSQLIEEISAIQNASDEEAAKREEELAEEKMLIEHYLKNWQKYGPRNNVSEFLEKYKAGKIELIKEDAPTTPEPVETIEEIVGQDSLEEQERDEKELKKDLEKKAEPKEKKSRGKLIEYDGKAMNLNDWARELGMIRQTLYARLYLQNWDVEKAFTTPTNKTK